MYDLDGQTLTVDDAPVSSIRWAATDTSSRTAGCLPKRAGVLFTVSELELLAPGRLNEMVVSDECAGDAGVERQWVKISSPTGSVFSPTPTASERTAPSEPDLTLFWYRVGTDGELLRMYRGDVPDDNQRTFAIDDSGLLDEDPDQSGAFDLDGDTLTFVAGTSRACWSGLA